MAASYGRQCAESGRVSPASPAGAGGTHMLHIDDIFPQVAPTEGDTRMVIFLKNKIIFKNLKVVLTEEGEGGWEQRAHLEKIKNRTIVVLVPKYEGRPTSPGGRARVSVYVCNMAGERVSDAVPFYYQRSRLPAHAQDSASPDALQEMRPKRVCTADSTYKAVHETSDEDIIEKELTKHFSTMKTTTRRPLKTSTFRR